MNPVNAMAEVRAHMHYSEIGVKIWIHVAIVYKVLCKLELMVVRFLLESALEISFYFLPLHFSMYGLELGKNVKGGLFFVSNLFCWLPQFYIHLASAIY